MDANFLKAGEGQAISLGGVRMVVKEDGARTRRTLGMAEFEVPPHGHNTPPPHVHHAHEEGFYILAGELEFKVGTDTIRAGQGAFVMVPIGIAHTFSNPTDQPARFLNTFTPRHYLGYLEELGQIYQAAALPGRKRLAGVMARYHPVVVSYPPYLFTERIIS